MLLVPPLLVRVLQWMVVIVDEGLRETVLFVTLGKSETYKGTIILRETRTSRRFITKGN